MQVDQSHLMTFTLLIFTHEKWNEMRYGIKNEMELQVHNGVK